MSEEFEAWAEKEGLLLNRISPRPGSRYLSPTTDIAHQAWSAAMILCVGEMIEREREIRRALEPPEQEGCGVSELNATGTEGRVCS